MTTYYDPIELEELEIDETTILYLVKISDTSFSIKGISSGIDQLPSDPTTHAKEYWRLDTKKLLNKCNDTVIFPENKLLEAPLSLDDVRNYLEFDPTLIVATKFDEAVRQLLVDEWSNDIVRGMNQEFQSSARNQNGFFVQNLVRALASIPSSINSQDLSNALYGLSRLASQAVPMNNGVNEDVEMLEEDDSYFFNP